MSKVVHLIFYYNVTGQSQYEKLQNRFMHFKCAFILATVLNTRVLKKGIFLERERSVTPTNCVGTTAWYYRSSPVTTALGASATSVLPPRIYRPLFVLT